MSKYGKYWTTITDKSKAKINLIILFRQFKYYKYLKIQST